MTMHGGKLTIFDYNGCLFVEVQRFEGRLYLLKLNMVDQCMLTIDDNSENWLWYSWSRHINFYSLKEMLSKHLMEGFPQINIHDHLYYNCVAMKQHWTPFPQASSFRAFEPLELIYANICGPITPPTLGGSRYFLLIIDNYSHLMWVAMLKQNSNAFVAFKCFKTLVEIEKGVKIKNFISNIRGEFTFDEFDNYYVSQDIKRQLTAPYSPQQNGVVERKNQTVMYMV